MVWRSDQNCWPWFRALCRTKLLPVTHVLVDTSMLTFKLAYQISNVSDDLKWTTNTRDYCVISFLRHNWQYLWFWKIFFCSFICYPSTTCPPIFLPIYNGFYPSKWWVDGSLHKTMVVLHYKKSPICRQKVFTTNFTLYFHTTSYTFVHNILWIQCLANLCFIQ